MARAISTVEAARWAARVVAVDRSDVVLERARALARRRRVSNVVWKRGELEKLPIKDAAVDVALLSQALHHASSPARAIAEAARIAVPGGRVLVLDLREHQEDWVRAKLGDRTLGFKDEDLKRMMIDGRSARREGQRRGPEGRGSVHGADCVRDQGRRRPRKQARNTSQKRTKPSTERSP